jgi:hypothetical protein
LIRTNVHNLPYPWQRFAEDKNYTKANADFSVSELIKPPRVVQLTAKNSDRIVVDLSEEVASLIGTAMHDRLAQYVDPKDQAEEIMVAEVCGVKVKGQPDLYEVLAMDGDTLWDYKLCSVWAWMLDGKNEWEQQLNFYCELRRRLGKPQPKRLMVCAAFTDWHKSEAQNSVDYPDAKALVMPVHLWTPDQQRVLLEKRVELHKAARAAAVEDLPRCTTYAEAARKNECWEKPATYAVIKPGREKAVKLFKIADYPKPADALAEANELAKAEKGHVVKRLAARTRCEQWCSASPFCSQYEEFKAERDAGIKAEAAAKRGELQPGLL